MHLWHLDVFKFFWTWLDLRLACMLLQCHSCVSTAMHICCGNKLFMGICTFRNLIDHILSYFGKAGQLLWGFESVNNEFHVTVESSQHVLDVFALWISAWSVNVGGNPSSWIWSICPFLSQVTSVYTGMCTHCSISKTRLSESVSDSNKNYRTWINIHFLLNWNIYSNWLDCALHLCNKTARMIPHHSAKATDWTTVLFGIKMIHFWNTNVRTDLQLYAWW